VSVQEFEAKLAADNPVFASIKESYDRERRTTTRTTYEVDFITYFTKLTDLGAKFNKDAYLHSVEGVRLQ
jgi:L-ascorbate peroxidase